MFTVLKKEDYLLIKEEATVVLQKQNIIIFMISYWVLFFLLRLR